MAIKNEHSDWFFFPYYGGRTAVDGYDHGRCASRIFSGLPPYTFIFNNGLSNCWLFLIIIGKTYPAPHKNWRHRHISVVLLLCQIGVVQMYTSLLTWLYFMHLHKKCLQGQWSVRFLCYVTETNVAALWTTSTQF